MEFESEKEGDKYRVGILSWDIEFPFLNGKFSNEIVIF